MLANRYKCLTTTTNTLPSIRMAYECFRICCEYALQILGAFFESSQQPEKVTSLLVNVLSVLQDLHWNQVQTLKNCYDFHFTPIYRQKKDLSNDVSFMKIVHVVSDFRPERQYIVFPLVCYLIFPWLHL